MLDSKYTTVRNLPLRELRNPEYVDMVLEFAGELAPPCIAEILMRKLQSSDDLFVPQGQDKASIIS